MIYNIILPLLILSAIYGLAIFGLFVVLRKVGIPSEKRIMLSFLMFGIVTGFLVAWRWAWHRDTDILINIFTVFLGDEVYKLSVIYIGDISSPNAHYTIPWISRIPQVYVIVSVIFWGLMGLLIQFIYNKGRLMKFA